MPGLVTKAARANIDQQRKFIMINTLLWLTCEGETLLDALHFFCCRAAFSESIILVIRLQFESKMILKLRLATTDANDRRPPGTAGSSGHCCLRPGSDCSFRGDPDYIRFSAARLLFSHDSESPEALCLAATARQLSVVTVQEMTVTDVMKGKSARRGNNFRFD